MAHKKLILDGRVINVPTGAKTLLTSLKKRGAMNTHKYNAMKILELNNKYKQFNLKFHCHE